MSYDDLSSSEIESQRISEQIRIETNMFGKQISTFSTTQLYTAKTVYPSELYNIDPFGGSRKKYQTSNANSQYQYTNSNNNSFSIIKFIKNLFKRNENIIIENKNFDTSDTDDKSENIIDENKIYTNKFLGFCGDSLILSSFGGVEISKLKSSDKILSWDCVKNTLVENQIEHIVKFDENLTWNIAACGFIKPLNTFKFQSILTKIGWKKAEDIVNNDKIMTIGKKNGWRRVDQSKRTMEEERSFSIILKSPNINNFIVDGVVCKSIHIKP